MGVLSDGAETQMTEHTHTQLILIYKFLQTLPSLQGVQQELCTKW
jgi:hypothetical protein